MRRRLQFYDGRQPDGEGVHFGHHPGGSDGTGFRGKGTDRPPEQRRRENRIPKCHNTPYAVSTSPPASALSGGGYKTVLIELQKAKYTTDIMRFRRYLGRHYQDTENTYDDKYHLKARQIYCIYGQ